MKTYAKVEWTVSDLQSIDPDMTDEQAADWLEANSKHIQSRLIELGWDVISNLLIYYNNNNNNNNKQ